MLEISIIGVVVLATVIIFVLAKKHGIVMRPDAGGLEAFPRELDANEKTKQER